jgi:hypothetical protein
MNSLFYIKQFAKLFFSNCVFFRSVSPHSCLLATHFIKSFFGKESPVKVEIFLGMLATRAPSGNWKRKTNVNNPLSVSFPNFDKYFFMKKNDSNSTDFEVFLFKSPDFYDNFQKVAKNKKGFCFFPITFKSTM